MKVSLALAMAGSALVAAGSAQAASGPNLPCPDTSATCVQLGTVQSGASPYFVRTDGGTDPTDDYIVTQFGATPNAAGTTFDDEFVFETLANGTGSGSVSASFTIPTGTMSPTNYLSNVSVAINGQNAPLTSSAGGFSLFETNIPIAADEIDTVRVTGDVVGHGAAFDGTATFQASPVSAAPEPASWALMIFGIGLTGMMLRRRSDSASFV